MAHKIHTSEGIVLMKEGQGEASASVLILMREYGLVRVRAQSARRSEGKLRYALEPMTVGQYSFVRGAQSNRLVGAQADSVLLNIEQTSARRASGQIGKLLLRMLAGEEEQPELFDSIKNGFKFISKCEEAEIPNAECVLVLTILSKLGYISEDASLMRFTEEPLSKELVGGLDALRPQALRVINTALTLSGL